MLHGESVTIVLREPCHLGEKKLGLSMSSLRHVFICTLFALGGRYKNIARATEAAEMPNKKISSCAVDTDVVVLVISVVQLSAGLAKIAVGVKSNCLAFLFTHRVQ